MKAGGSFANIPGIMCKFYKIVIYRCAKFTSIESVELYLTYLVLHIKECKLFTTGIEFYRLPFECLKCAKMPKVPKIVEFCLF
jgi:hypothetical protein